MYCGYVQHDKNLNLKHNCYVKYPHTTYNIYIYKRKNQRVSEYYPSLAYYYYAFQISSRGES